VADLVDCNVWIERVLGITVAAPTASAEASLDDEPVAEAPIDQATSRQDELIRLRTAIDSALDVADGFRDERSKPLSGYAEVVNAVAGWRTRRAAFDDARINPIVADADLAAMVNARDAARKLLDEINTKMRAKNMAEWPAEPEADATEARRLGAAKRCIDLLPASTAKTALEDRLKTANGELAEPSTRPSDFAETVEALWRDAVKAVAPKKTELRQELQTRLDRLSRSAAVAEKLNATNQISIQLGLLTDRAAEADALGDTGTTPQEALWADVLADAGGAVADALKAVAARSAVASTVHVLTILLGDLAAEDTDRTRIESAIKGLQDGLAADCKNSPDIKGLRTAWEGRQKAAEAIGKDLRSVQTTPRDLVAARQEVEKRLATLQKLVDSIATPLDFPSLGNKDQSLLTKQYTALAKGCEAQKSTPVKLDDADAGKLRGMLEKLNGHIQQAQEIKLRTMSGPDIDEEMSGFPPEGMDPSAPEAQAFCRAALSVRYKMEVVIPDGMQVTRLPELYELFARVPAGHVGHDMLASLEYETQAGASHFKLDEKKQGKIVLTSLKGAGYETGELYAIPDVTDKKARVKYFTVAALHEIGHAVDAKGTIMQSHVQDDGFGGWNKETIDSVATVFATRLKREFSTAPQPDLLALMRQMLLAGRCDKPVSARAPLGGLLAIWDTVVPKATAYAKTRDPGSSPWKLSIDGGDRRYYHEAYGGQWVSYSADVRAAQYVSDYQWRAPQEWFAELYAWYYMEEDKEMQKKKAAKLPRAVKDLILL
jgi:hypothetical protein